MKPISFCGVGISALLLAASLTAANAADMSVKAPPPAPAPVAVTDWTGVYFDFGGGWTSNRFNWQLADPVPATLTPFSLTSNNGVGAAHLGYQQQWGSIVLGVEGGGTFNFGKVRPAAVVANGTGVGACAGFDTCLMWAEPLITVGGKLGYAWQNWLVYGVGGGARGVIDSQFILNTGVPFDSASAAHTGYYAGGGIDYLLSHQGLADVIVGAEYEHVDLGTTGCAISSAPTPVALQNCSATGGPNNRFLGAKEDMVLGKLTLKFNPWGSH